MVTMAGFTALAMAIIGVAVSMTGPAAALAPPRKRKVQAESQARLLELTPHNFEQATLQYPVLLIAFTKPRCKSCVMVVQELAKAAKELALLDPPVTAAYISASPETVQLGLQLQATTYPDLKVVRPGIVVDGKFGLLAFSCRIALF